MDIIESLLDQIAIERPFVITIGNYDGVHLGHQAIFSKLKQRAARINGETMVISFTNHPLEVLQPGLVVPLLCTLQHKIKLIEGQGIDHLMLLRFTKEFSQQTPEEFLEKVQKWHPFFYLLLGEEATFGKDRQGSSDRIQRLSRELGFEVEYMKKFSLEGESISSRKVRLLITNGKLKLAEQLLGRKYSIYCPINHIQHQDMLSIDSTGLCLPPSGDYTIQLKYDEFIGKGVIQIRDAAILNVALESFKKDLALGSYVELIF